MGRGEDIERLDAERVACGKDRLLGCVPYNEGEHADETAEGGRAPLRQRSEQHLGIGLAAEEMSGRLELVAQLDVVVDLTIVDDPVALIGIGHRLPGRVGQVDDAEPPMAQRHRAGNAVEYPPAGSVRPAVRHDIDMAGFGSKTQREPDAAHPSGRDYAAHRCTLMSSSSSSKSGVSDGASS